MYLRCSEGSLEWLYPTGAIIVNLRPNTFPKAGAETQLSACVKPRGDSSGASVFVERAGVMRMLLSEEEQAAGRVRCFSLDEGALFVQASTHTDISKRVTAFQYELIRGERTAAGTMLSSTGKVQIWDLEQTYGSVALYDVECDETDVLLHIYFFYRLIILAHYAPVIINARCTVHQCEE